VSLINITIDNIKVRAEEGITILDAAKKAGIKIPTLCVMPELGFTPLCLSGKKRIRNLY